MKSFRDLTTEVEMVDTPFERKLRQLHEPQVWDLPPEMSGDDVIALMPKDHSRSQDIDQPQFCATCGTEVCPDCGGMQCDCDVNEARRCTCGMMKEDQDVMTPISSIIEDISQLWEEISHKYDVDPESAHVVLEDLGEIRSYLKSSIPATTADPEPRTTDDAAPTRDSVASIPTMPPHKTAKSGDDNVYKPIKTRYGSIFEAYIPGQFLLRDGAQVKISQDEAMLLNRLRSTLTNENAKAMDVKMKKGFVNFSNMMQFAKTTMGEK